MRTNPHTLVIDIDDTISRKPEGLGYSDCEPVKAVVDMLRKYHEDGWVIVIYTSRNMRTFDGDLGRICANTLPIMIDWLKRNNVPYDAIVPGKPWCGEEGFYVDDKAVRPSEFVTMTPDEIRSLLDKEKEVR